MQYIVAESSRLAPYYPKAVFDYLNKSRNLKSFYEFYPDLAGYGNKLKSRTFLPTKRKTLQKALKNQYDGLLKQPGSELVKRNIDLLADENTFTVTTGQQIHIYLGPLYVAYKILTTVARCQWLAENFKGYNFVPVFWMATEDHDFEEISGIKLYNREFKWPQTEGYTGAVGRIHPATINELDAAILPVIENDEEAKRILALFHAAYEKCPSLAAATRSVLHSLFAHTGLVILDADDKELKKIFRPFIKEDIFKNQNGEVVNHTTEQLQEHYKTQIHPREINFFFMDEKGRYRLTKEGDIYKTIGADYQFDEVKLTYEIDKHPEKFSPNVLMRPLYQEVILPNLSYVGGAAEINYWLQLKEMFKVNGVQFPVLELRKSLIVLNEKMVEKINGLGLTPQDFLSSEVDLETGFLKQNEDGNASVNFSAHYQLILSELETLKQKALAVDNNLKPFLEGEFKRIAETFEKLDNKLEKTGKRAFETQLKAIETIKTKYFAPGALAERTDTVLSFPVIINEKLIAQLLKTFNHENMPLIIVMPPLI